MLLFCCTDTVPDAAEGSVQVPPPSLLSYSAPPVAMYTVLSLVGKLGDSAMYVGGGTVPREMGTGELVGVHCCPASAGKGAAESNMPVRAVAASFFNKKHSPFGLLYFVSIRGQKNKGARPFLLNYLQSNHPYDMDLPL